MGKDINKLIMTAIGATVLVGLTAMVVTRKHKKIKETVSKVEVKTETRETEEETDSSVEGAVDVNYEDVNVDDSDIDITKANGK